MTKKYAFTTRQIHAGTPADPTTGAIQTPIYQTASYEFKSAEQAADLFALRDVGFIYSRLTNPTVSALQARICDLEGGAGAVATSSGHAAQILAFFPLLSPGKNIVASNRLYGGTLTQLTQTIKRFGWEAKIVDFGDLDAVKNAIDDDTRAVYSESISNPTGYVVDLKEIAKIAADAKIPYLVDNTTATPYLINPIEHGATIVIHSLTKYITGSASVLGGIVIDSGKFDWASSDKFPALSESNPSYNDLNFFESFKSLAYTFYGIAVGLRDLGATLNPQAAHYTLIGVETLSLRVERHVQNAKEIATWLEQHPEVRKVSYSGLESSSNYEISKKYSPKGAGALLTFNLKGGYEKAKQFVKKLEIFVHTANLGDSRSLVIHPASTTHSQLNEESRIKAGAEEDVVRLSIGLEDVNDLKADIEQALL